MEELLLSQIEQQKALLDKSIGMYRMFDRYLRLPQVKSQAVKPAVGFMGTGDGLEIKSFIWAAENRSEDELKNELLRKPIKFEVGKRAKIVPYKSPPNSIQYWAFDYTTKPTAAIQSNPFAKNFLKDVTVLPADFRSIPLPNQALDYCIVRNPYWDELDQTNEVPQVFAEFDRVLKPSGILWMTFLSKEEYQQAKENLSTISSYEILVDEENKQQTVPGTFKDPATGDNTPYPWDKILLIAKKSSGDITSSKGS